jgi:4-amino-4-deoxy-L-arabinose transferase-like glycosyltransferase
MKLQGLGSRARRSTFYTWCEHQAIAHPVLFVFTGALIVRVVVALVLSVTVGMGPFSDAKVFDHLASSWANGLSHHWDGTDKLFFNRLGGYVVPLGALYRVFGAHLFVGQLLAALFGAVAAAALCALVLIAADRRAALTAGFIVMLFPSLVLWSSVPYRDSAVWAATTLAALLVAIGARARGWTLIAVGAGIAMLVFVLGHLRQTTTVAVCGALVIAALLSERRARVRRVAGALVIAVLVPSYLGIGPVGIDLVHPLGEVRGALACGAESKVTTCEPDSDFASDSDGGASISDATTTADLEHLPRGLSVMLLEPFPWASADSFQAQLAKLSLLYWLPLIVLAGFGVSAAYQRRRELSFLVLTAGALLLVYALGEGNLGTAFRHRSELVPALAAVAALGIPRAMARWRDRRPGHQTTRQVLGAPSSAAPPRDGPFREG